jgi:hypothetical protein
MPSAGATQEVAEAEENCGMEGRDKHGEQQRERIDLQQDTQAVGRSGCFLLHSDSVAPTGILSQEIVASGKSLRPITDLANNHRFAHKSRKGRSSDDIPMHANAINAIVRELMISFVWRAKSRVASFGKWLHGEVKSGAGISNRRHKAAGEEIEVHEARKKEPLHLS